MVYLVIVVTETREFAFDVKTFRQADVVAAGGNFGVLDGRE